MMQGPHPELQISTNIYFLYNLRRWCIFLQIEQIGIHHLISPSFTTTGERRRSVNGFDRSVFVGFRQTIMKWKPLRLYMESLSYIYALLSKPSRSSTKPRIPELLSSVSMVRASISQICFILHIAKTVTTECGVIFSVPHLNFLAYMASIDL